MAVLLLVVGTFTIWQQVNADNDKEEKEGAT